MNDINIMVTSANSEDAALVAGVIGDALTSYGFQGVEVEPSMAAEESGGYLQTLMQISPHLLEVPINIGFGGADNASYEPD